jgi:pilus assembly protein CpaE
MTQAALNTAPLEDDLDIDLDDLDDLDDAELQKLLDEEDELDEPDFSPQVPAPIPLAAASVPEQEPLVDPATLTMRPVPRINIAVFCETSGMTALMERAAADRRLAKAHVTIQHGDAFKAAEVFSQEPTPNLLVLESSGTAQDLLGGLAALSEVCDPSTQVLVTGPLNDIQLYRALMDRGISDYLVAPRSPLEIVSAIGSLYADPSAPPVGKSYVFVGARGGAGSSTVCHNVAWAMAERCRTDTVLMDLDLAFGTGSLDFERDPSQGLAEALNAPERLDDVLLDRLLQKCTDRLSLFAAPNLLDRDYDIPAESFEQVIDLVRAGAPAVAVDLPHLWTGWAQKMLMSADEIVITATPDLASFRNAKNIVETIAASRGNDGAPIIVLNQTGVKGRPEVGADQFAESIGREPAHVIPFDPASFGIAATNAQTMFEAAPKAKATAAFDALARQLIGQGDAPGIKAKVPGVKGLLGLLR